MAKMMAYHGDRYEVANIKTGYRCLDTLPRQEESVEGCREAIDRRNAWAVENDHPQEQYLIIHTTWTRVFTPNCNYFVSSNETVTVVELYPQN